MSARSACWASRFQLCSYPQSTHYSHVNGDGPDILHTQRNARAPRSDIFALADRNARRGSCVRAQQRTGVTRWCPRWGRRAVLADAECPLRRYRDRVRYSVHAPGPTRSPVTYTAPAARAPLSQCDDGKCEKKKRKHTSKLGSLRRAHQNMADKLREEARAKAQRGRMTLEQTLSTTPRPSHGVDVTAARRRAEEMALKAAARLREKKQREPRPPPNAFATESRASAAPLRENNERAVRQAIEERGFQLLGTSLKAFLMEPSPRLRRPSHGAPAAAAAAAAASARKGPSSGGAAGSASAVSPERDIFMIVDRDRRGAISFDELKAGVFLFCFFERRPQNHAPTEDELHAWFEDASLNDDGQMERDTFESILRVEMDPQRRARRAREGPQTPSRRPPQASNSKPWPTSPPSPMNQAANVVPAGFIRSFAIATPPSSPRAAVKSSTYTSFHALGRGSAF
jgi:hypothetical protein